MIYFLVSIDTECDKGVGWQSQIPFKFNGIIHGIADKLQPLFSEYGVIPTYLISPEVFSDSTSIDILGNLGNRAELGTHLHAEYIEPEADWDSHRTLDFQSDYTPQIELEKIENLTRLFQKTFKYSPKSFRAGRFGISRHTHSILQQLGYLVDSSVTPFLKWNRHPHAGVNFLGSPIEPYFPAKDDFRKEGEMKVLEVPITIYNKVVGRLPKILLRSINPFNKFHGFFLYKVLKTQYYSVWLRPTFSDENEMRSLINLLLKKANKISPLVFNMMFHNVEFVPSASPYSKTEEEVNILIHRMQKFFDFLFNNFSVTSVGLSKIYELYA